jgi:hypothetical protein
MKSITLALMFLALTVSGRAEIVYDNVQDYGDTFYPGPPGGDAEFGDQLQLAGTGRTITQFQFEYFGEFSPTGDETVRVRIYANDGPGQVFDPNAQPPVTIPNTEQPGTLLYESELLPVYPLWNTLTLRGLSIKVTNTITWTVKFSGGLNGTYNHRAGLTFYDPPTVGFSYDDFWIKLEGQWMLWHFPGSNPMANFSARVYADPGTPWEMTLAPQSTNGQYHLTLNGAAYQFGDLAYSTNLIDWNLLERFVFLGKPLDYPQFEIPAFGQRYYRLALVTNVEPQVVSATHQTNGSYRLEVEGWPGQSFLLEASSDSNFWIPIHASTLTGSRYRYTHESADAFEQKYYRASLIATPQVIHDMPEADANGVMLLVSGPRGRDCAVQTSRDLTNWTTLCTNTFSFAYSVTSPLASNTISFAFGSFYYRDKLATNDAARFYRSLLLPP